MCLIIHKPTAEAVIPDYILNNAETINQDGFGIVYTDNNECKRTMDYNYARELILAERPFVAHYRYTTRGVTNKKNCHPYHISNYTRLFSNGTVADLGDNFVTDTKVVAEYLNNIPEKFWSKLLSMTDTRFAITHPNGTVERYGQWHERDGIYYSKNNCFYTKKSNIGYHYSAWNDDHVDYWGNYNSRTTTPITLDEPDAEDWLDIHKVAVYGTLKMGKGNHRLLANSEYVGAGVTVNKYGMQNHGIPYVFEYVTRDQISVEVYDVPDEQDRLALDNLESHPDHYERKLIDVELLDGSTVTCWLYFGNHLYHDTTMRYISTY